MIGVLTGTVLFSDGKEAILQTQSGIGYQVFCHYILPEGAESSLFVSHIVRETAELLFAFKNLREKKLFELLTTVKGVGPKSGYAIVCGMSIDRTIDAVITSDQKALTKIVGVGVKAASQIILDLQKKIHKVKMYSSEPLGSFSYVEPATKPVEVMMKPVKPEQVDMGVKIDSEQILNDTLLACENLGFHSEKVIPLAQKILKENSIQKPEQLVHLVLKEI